MTLSDNLVRQLEVRKWRIGALFLLTFGTLVLANIIGIRLPQYLSLILLLVWLPALLLMRRMRRMRPVCPACQTKWRFLVQVGDLTGQSGPRLTHGPYCAARLAEELTDSTGQASVDSSLIVGLKRDRIQYFVRKAGFDIDCWDVK